jgi:uncharacterized membrane protein YgcG
MKRFRALPLYVLIVPLTAAAARPKAPSGAVGDFAGIMGAEDIRRIEKLAGELEKKTGAEPAVVTVETIAPCETIEQYALYLFKTWRIGAKGPG